MADEGYMHVCTRESIHRAMQEQVESHPADDGRVGVKVRGHVQEFCVPVDPERSPERRAFDALVEAAEIVGKPLGLTVGVAADV